MSLTVITSDQISQNTAFTLQANLVMGNVTMSNTGITVGNVEVGTASIKAGNSSVNISINSTSIAINGSAGSNNQVLATNGSAAYWTTAAAGATGGGSDMVFWLNNTAVSANYTIPANTNAGTFGPVTIQSSAIVTISNTSTWTIV